MTHPRIKDNDRDEITAEMDGREIRGWSYADEKERRVKMLAAREFAEGWYQATQAKGAWRDISTAPDFARVFVAGWQPPHDSVAGYWWWHEDVCEDGKAIETPNATHWCPISIPYFPSMTADMARSEVAL